MPRVLTIVLHGASGAQACRPHIGARVGVASGVAERGADSVAVGLPTDGAGVDGAGVGAVATASHAQSQTARTRPPRARIRPPTLRAPRPYAHLVHLAAASSAGGLALPLYGLLLRVLLAPEDDLAVLCIHEDRVALLELAGEHLLRERVDNEPLDGPFDRTRPINRVGSFLGDERLRLVGG